MAGVLKNSRSDAESRETSGRSKLGQKRLSVVELVEKAKIELSQVLGKKVYLVSGISEMADGQWSTEIEMIEEEHMISNFDVIGTYVVTLDENGNLINWNRKSLRKRD